MALDKNKKYVYEHWLDGECFYVGHGNWDRPYRFTTNGDCRSNKWAEHVGDRKHDIDVKIIAKFDNKKEAVAYERELTIHHRESGSPLVNILDGENHTEFTKRNISKTSKGRVNAMKGKHYSGEALRNIQDARKRGADHPMYGTHRSESTRRKISESQIGKQISQETKDKIGVIHRGKTRSEEEKQKQSDSLVGKYRGVDCKTSHSVKIVDPDGGCLVFGSLREMERETPFSRTSISRRLKNDNNYVNRYGFSFSFITREEAVSLGCVNNARKNGIPERLRQ